jgi:predicted enzyme related to lactoylglutathione lyase
LNKIPLLLLSALMLIGIYSCTSTTLNLPAVTTQDTGTRLPGKVIWHDLISEDPATAKRFYSELFGWSFKSIAGSDYSLIYHGDSIIGGIVNASVFEQHDNVSQWVAVLSVTDIEEAVAQATQAGGQILGGPIDAGDRGQLAVLKDPQGAVVALLQTSEGDPLDRDAEIGEFMWNELWTSDASQATAFYHLLVGYQQGSRSLSDGNDYPYVLSGGQPRAAILANPIPGLDPTWVSYVRVADTEAITAQVAGLGGEIMLPSQANPLGGQLAIITDPSGAGLVIQTWDQSMRESTP